MGQKEIGVAGQLAEESAKLGGRAYYVGGFVRDSLLGLETKDVDIEVHGITSEQLEKILDSLGERTEYGKSFGIYGLKGLNIDIALPRKERKNGIGHRAFEIKVDPFIGLERAVLRRDFTVNAIMRDVLSGKLIDLVGGVEDLKKRSLRCVDRHSFSDDPLRVLRAAQFAARFRLEPTDEILELCQNTDIRGLARERIEGEVSKALLKSEKPSVFFEFLRSCQKLEEYFPKLYALIGVAQDPVRHPEGDVWNHTMKVIDAAARFRESSTNPFGFMLAAAFHDLGKILSTAVGKDGKLHAYGHETLGIPLVKDQLAYITENRRLCSYVENLIRLHMQPGAAAAMSVKAKTTNRMFASSFDPEALIALSKADYLGIGNNTESGYAEAEFFLKERLVHYRQLMSKPYIMTNELLAAGIIPGRGMAAALELAGKLRLAEVDRESAIKQVISMKDEFNRVR